jgi:hypothetical protein
LTGRSCWTAVVISAISIANPPSPTIATDWRPGYANWPAMANGRPGAIEAIMPVPVSLCLGRNIRLRAAKCVFAPQSSEITASSAIRFDHHLGTQRGA